MAEIVLEHVNKSYPNGHTAVKDLNLTIADGEFLILVGPSGCGKTTTLNMIAGLEDISSGELRIGGERVNEKAPKDRDIAMVFQSYALYPHMTVRQNIAFPLTLAKMKKAEIAQKVAETAKILDLTDFLDRKPSQLSGGQRQRVAMGRAIVRHPKAFLMDEPLSNLDAKLRVQVRGEIARLQKRLGTTTVYVTHDQTEAMTLADRIVVLRKGKIEQVGSPRELYDAPANIFVAGFIGTPKMNIIDISGVHQLSLGRPAPATATRIGFRPEHCARLAGDADGLSVPLVDARLLAVENLGDRSFRYLSTEFGEMAVIGSETDEAGQMPCTVYVPNGRLHFFDADGNRVVD